MNDIVNAYMYTYNSQLCDNKSAIIAEIVI